MYESCAVHITRSWLDRPSANGMNPMKTETIRAALDRIEAEENIRIVYACESGSRAWGFASLDSD